MYSESDWVQSKIDTDCAYNINISYRICYRFLLSYPLMGAFMYSNFLDIP